MTILNRGSNVPTQLPREFCQINRGTLCAEFRDALGICEAERVQNRKRFFERESGSIDFEMVC